jgi:hypothetical protein
VLKGLAILTRRKVAPFASGESARQLPRDTRFRRVSAALPAVAMALLAMLYGP